MRAYTGRLLSGKVQNPRYRPGGHRDGAPEAWTAQLRQQPQPAYTMEERMPWPKGLPETAPTGTISCHFADGSEIRKTCIEVSGVCGSNWFPRLDE